jgi:hypothetical protein
MYAQDRVPGTGEPTLDFPAIFDVADSISLRGQLQTKRRIRAQLAALILAAACGVVSLKIGTAPVVVDWTGLVAAAAFLFVLVVQIARGTRKAEQSWYDGRVVTESVKSLAWKYAVGGRPFPIGDAQADSADRLLIGRLHEIVGQMEGLTFVPPLRAEEQPISPTMRALRGQPLSIRKAAYRKGRVQDQQSWYASKAAWNQRRITRFKIVLIALAAIGCLTGIVRATGLSPLDFLGLVATMMATVFVLLRLGQHETLARSYTVASIELTAIQQKLDFVHSEAEWSTFVAEAEQAISREHSLWLASYSTGSPPSQ